MNEGLVVIVVDDAAAWRVMPPRGPVATGALFVFETGVHECQQWLMPIEGLRNRAG
jgi:hypothetical protein